MLKNRFFKKTLCAALSALLLLSAFCLGAVVPSVKVLAGDFRSSALPMGDLTFVVPEAIYLYPNGSSWTAATSTPFQYYVNNSAANEPLNTADTTGKIYYVYDYEFDQHQYGAATAEIGWQFVDASFHALSGGSVTLSSSTIASGGSVDITGGMSPSLGSAVNGCYILWTLTLTDEADGRVKTAYALTYVYKPYVVPVGAMVRTKNLWGLTTYISFAQQLTWISGMHSVTQQTEGTHDGNYYPNYSGSYGMSAFITAGNTAYVGDTAYETGLGKMQDQAWTASNAGATRYKLAFLNTPESTAHFNDTEGHDNSAATNWGSSSSSGATFNVSSFDYYYKENGATDHNCLAAVFATPYGNITIDTSRYTNLSQIPNLAVGLMATDNQEGENGNWYVGDYSEGSRSLGYNGTKSDTSSDSRSEYFNDRVYIIAGQGTNSWDNYGDYEAEGVKYAGAWPRTLIGVPAANDPEDSSKYVSTYNYAVKGMFSTEDPGNSSDFCFTHAMVRLSAKQFNKSTLRAAVQRAVSKLPSLGVTGISNGNISSCYFDSNSNYKWTALQLAFKNALIGLTTLNSTANPNDLANALNNALDALCTKVEVSANGGSFATLNTLEYVNIGTDQWYRYTPTYTSPSKQYYNFKGWSANPDTHSGLSYVNVGYNGHVYATWEPVPYTITLVPADDDNVNTETKTAAFNIESAGTLSEIFASEENAANGLENYPAPRQGWGFKCWQVIAADAGSSWTVGDMIPSSRYISGAHGSVTLKAVWEEGAVDVNVYVYLMNKTGSYLTNNRLVPTETHLEGGARTNKLFRLPEDPAEREGFTVDMQKSRLYCTPAANGSSVIKVFYARNQYDVTFKNYNGAELQAARPYYYETAPVYTGVTPRRDAENGIRYTFFGWNDGTNTYTPAELAEYEVTADTVFTAVYTETEQLFSVSAEPGAGAQISCEAGTYLYGDTLTVSASAEPGYIADGLKLFANGEEVSNPYSLTVTEDVVFTTNDLETKPNFFVSFYTFDGEKIETVSVSEGGSAEGLVEAPEREGYTFAQWSLPIDNVTENLTVIAQYTKDGAANHTFNFFQDAKLLATLVREAGEEFGYPEDVLGQPAKTGFDFMGWDKEFSPAAQDLDVYAVFQPNGYVETHTLTVKFGYEKDDVVYTQETGTTATVEYPERSGHVFTGWTGDTDNLNGTRYTFDIDDETITATWYDLSALNTAAGQIEAILAERSLYRSDYTLRLDALLLEKGEKTAAVPASAAALDDLLDRMNTAIGQKDAYLLYTLHVIADGVEVQTLQNIAGDTVTVSASPEKDGYSFNGWAKTEGPGSVDGAVFLFGEGNAVIEATWVIDNAAIAALRAQIEALSGDIYCEEYLNALMAELTALEAMDLSDPNNNEAVNEAIVSLSSLLAEKDQHKHKFTVLVGNDPNEPPTCTDYGYQIYRCENCESKTTRVRVEPLGHDWGEWEVITEATYGVDGESKRTCARCGEVETVVTSLNDQSDKAIRFVTMNNMEYVLNVGEGVRIKTLTTYRWFSSQELKFKVKIKEGFGFPDYIVYLNGEIITPDGSGYYTVPASAELATVSIAGVAPQNPLNPGGDDSSSSSGKISFWEWLVRFFRSIADFFQRLFRR